MLKISPAAQVRPDNRSSSQAWGRVERGSGRYQCGLLAGRISLDGPEDRLLHFGPDVIVEEAVHGTDIKRRIGIIRH
jgi:hypothetical protein